MANQTVISPYDFITVKDNVSRKMLGQSDGHHLFCQHGFTGHITCSLTALTYLFIPSSNKGDISGRGKEDKIFYQPFYIQKDGKERKGQAGKGVKRDDELYALPSASIKGTLRSVAEALTNSCLSVIDEDALKECKPQGIGAASSNYCRLYTSEGHVGDGLCICCRLFGAAIKDKAPCAGSDNEQGDTEKRKKRNVFMGKLIINDAIMKENKGIVLCVPLKPLYSPEMKKSKGRKLYYHHPTFQGVRKTSYFSEENSNTTITPFSPKTAFKFTIQCENLSDEELGLLLWTLELDEGMAHKMGRGKPLGLGSVEIKVVEITKYHQMNRYTSLEGEEGQKQRENVTSQKDVLKEKFASSFPGSGKLKEMLALNSAQGKQIRYPSQRGGRGYNR